MSCGPSGRRSSCGSRAGWSCTTRSTLWGAAAPVRGLDFGRFGFGGLDFGGFGFGGFGFDGLGFGGFGFDGLSFGASNSRGSALFGQAPSLRLTSVRHADSMLIGKGSRGPEAVSWSLSDLCCVHSNSTA